jgi:acetoacetyl-CoA synthetase
MNSYAPLWAPTEAKVRGANLTRFADLVRRDYGAPSATGDLAVDYHQLWEWSNAEPEKFWAAVSVYSSIVADHLDGPAVISADTRLGKQWFPVTRLNYAENLLCGNDDELALIFANEMGQESRYSFGELRIQVAAVAAGLMREGVGPGDVVAGYLPNIPEAVIAMLATASLGAIWTSTSPDFGLDGVLERFGQLRPKVLFTADGYRYAGKDFSCLGTVAALVSQLHSIARTVVIAYATTSPDLQPLRNAVLFTDFARSERALTFKRMPFDAPLFIMFTSGTTGRPKCIVHGIGGTLLQHRKEHLLHADLKPGDRLFFFTTCGWMMWNWLVSGLASNVAIVLYDGSPMHPGPEVLWNLAERAAVTHFGTSPRYLAALEKAGYRPSEHHRLHSLRSILSTGSPLSPSQFEFAYTHIKSDQQLASISGGTDILSCFCLGVPWLPVYRGELQGPGLGMAVEIWSDNGERLLGQAGELVCTQAFPSMPLGFWDDHSGARYQAAYFERYTGVWHHGDRVIETEHGGYVFLGRSDAVLNPGGVRIGTAEIYRQVEKVADVVESLAIGQRVSDANGVQDERIVLFVRLREGAILDEPLHERIRRVIRDNTTPRHVPARIIAVPDIPRTRNGKIVEVAVRRVVHGQRVENVDALANPESLGYFQNLPELQSEAS